MQPERFIVVIWFGLARIGSGGSVLNVAEGRTKDACEKLIQKTLSSDANYQVSKAWQVRENFRDAFKNKTTAQGRAIFEEWFFDTLKCGISEVTEVAICSSATSMESSMP